ncbi:MAG: cardiolipin synthase [Phycisphaerales bacterium]|jgi:cardiolipin synthase|nr:cardiolipin synthase [Phycisphaerales bacterium]
MHDASWTVLLFVGELVLKVFMIFVILLQRKKSSSAKLAWILLLVALPFIGSAIYLLLGTTRLGALRRKRHREILKLIPVGYASHCPEVGHAKGSVVAEFQPIASIAEAVGASTVIGGNEAILFGDSDKMIDSLANDILQAKKHCHVLSYIMLDDDAGKKIAAALTEATKNGVTCRLLIDAVGSKNFLRSETCRALKASGVRVTEALPANIFRAALVRLDLRNHRKIAVIDNSVGYVGSQNIAEPSFAPKPKFAPWVDASLRLVGPSVRELQAVFIQDWFMDSDENLSSLLQESVQVVKQGFPVQFMATGPNSNNQALSQLLQTAFHSAREELVITTPYFAPDTSTESALEIAASRGVDTHLVVPARNDSWLVAAASRSRFGRLLDAGVQIHEFHGGLLHAKTMTIDKQLALIGSANLDRRSLELNFEISMLAYDSDFASHLRFLQQSYVSQSTLLEREVVSHWSLGRCAWQNAVGLISPIL